jgi:RNA polymerase sigma factor (TIGR02999 family)
MAAQTSLTEQLQRYFEGDIEVAESVLQTVLPQLHNIAERELRRERHGSHLSPTELIHEVWMKNMSKGGWEITSRQHFYALASLAMRHILVDFARARLAQRRGNGISPEPFDKAAFNQCAENTDLESIVRIGQLMDRLTAVDPQASRVVDMHYFVGFTFDEIAYHTGLTFRQVRHRWEKGRDWLKRHM